MKRRFDTLARDISFVLLVGTFTLSTGAVSAKDYTRSCTAQIGVSATTPRGQRLQGANFPAFTGKGTVGWYAPNKARERARRNIDECLNAAWNSRFSTSRHARCTESNKIYNFPFNGFHFAIQQAVCSANPGHETIFVNVNVTYDGQQGCLLNNNSWGRSLTSGYTINCPTREFERGVDRPGGDYRNFDLGRSDPALCRNACLNDQPRCRAWTYVRPGVQGASARCWLKSSVPSPTPSSNCTSGVISDL